MGAYSRHPKLGLDVTTGTLEGRRQTGLISHISMISGGHSTLHQIDISFQREFENVKTSVMLFASEGEAAVSESKACCVFCRIESTGVHSHGVGRNLVNVIRESTMTQRQRHLIVPSYSLTCSVEDDSLCDHLLFGVKPHSHHNTSNVAHASVSLPIDSAALRVMQS
ncbi:hypothetical protein TNCV_3566521 [Trichonephila clavipes]|nr:hypothetical protein TNCV_3566521 [Trichonephila clavipes]